jgi:hypothetical protein
VVFLNWAATNGAPNNRTKWSREGSVNGQHETINVSKAFRRLENYAEWMDHVNLMDPLQILSRKFGRPSRCKLPTMAAIVCAVPFKGTNHYATGRIARRTQFRFSTIEAPKLNKQAFNFNKHGAQRSSLSFSKSKISKKKQNLEQHRVVLFACCSICLLFDL